MPATKRELQEFTLDDLSEEDVKSYHTMVQDFNKQRT